MRQTTKIRANLQTAGWIAGSVVAISFGGWTVFCLLVAYGTWLAKALGVF